jgi:hypothetical protein
MSSPQWMQLRMALGLSSAPQLGHSFPMVDMEYAQWVSAHKGHNARSGCRGDVVVLWYYPPSARLKNANRVSFLLVF